MARPNKPARERIVILVAGDPVPEVRAARGDYRAIIADAIGDAFSGAYARVDARADPLPTVDARDAIVISGSTSNVDQREPWMLRAEAWLREAIPRDVPVLGLCFGHQLITQALGGEVGPNPRGREIGTLPIERLVEDPLFEGLGARFAANHCHSYTVARPPDGATVLARSAGDQRQAIKFAPLCYGVQFHPEFDRDIIQGFVRARREAMTLEGLDADSIHAAAADTPDARRVLANFMHLIAQ